MERRAKIGFGGLLLLLLVAGAMLLWDLPPLGSRVQGVLDLVQDRASLAATVAWLGWMGPPILVLLNALQIVVAPVPAYAIFAVAGLLYGPFWGGIYGTLGTLIGATAAMLLSRRFGRPLAARLLGPARLQRWDGVEMSHSTFFWGLLLLAPVGDLPYFLAGLAAVGLGKILLLTVITRVPTIFLVSAAASGMTVLNGEQLALVVGALVLVCGVLVQQRGRLLAWWERHIRRRLEPATHSGEGL